MKKLLILAIGIFLFPFAAFGMQPLTETEMGAIIASSGASTSIDDETIILHSESDTSPHPEPGISGSETESKNEVRRYGTGIAILIDDVVFVSGGSSEIWFQTRSR